jgi:hypothetical protein
MTQTDVAAAVQRLLAEAPEVADQAVEVRAEPGMVVLTGEVESEQRRAAIVALVRGNFPDLVVTARISVVRCDPPADPEVLS